MNTTEDSPREANQDETAQELFSKGLTCWKDKKVDRALHYFQRAHDASPENIVIASYLGVTLAKAGIIERGVSLCQEALNKRPFNEELLYNLGEAWLFAKNRPEARKAFLLGAKVCTNSNRFIDALLKMGVRRKPVIGFLSRDHFLNRWLGKMTYRPGTGRAEDVEN